MLPQVVAVVFSQADELRPADAREEEDAVTVTVLNVVALCHAAVVIVVVLPAARLVAVLAVLRAVAKEGTLAVAFEKGHGGAEDGAMLVRVPVPREEKNEEEEERLGLAVGSPDSVAFEDGYGAGCEWEWVALEDRGPPDPDGPAVPAEVAFGNG